MGKGNLIKKQQAAREARKAAQLKARAEWVYREPFASETPEEREPITLTVEEALALPWRPWDGEYEKHHYWLMLPREIPSGVPGQVCRVSDGSPEGREILHCWPNAGMMHECGGAGRDFLPDSMLLVSNAGLWPPYKGPKP